MANAKLKDLEAAIDQAMIKDRFRFRREIHAKNKRGNLSRKVAASVDLASRRALARPQPTFPEELPVSGKFDEIVAAINKHQVVVIAGETGSGKTTQIPKMCLAAGRGVFGLIGHTQPRRVAARAVSHRLAEELGVRHGESVGYQVRFTDETSDETHIKVMTDGILLAETQHDRFLERYDTLIIDEAHERSLNIDFLLGYLKRILPKRKDLRVVITSATLDVDRFSRHFGNAPVIEVSGRTYPVEVIYRPPEPDDRERESDTDEVMYQGILDALQEIQLLDRKRNAMGDVLVFLPGEREIREVSALIRKADLRNPVVLPLYSRLGSREQNRVFQAGGGWRIVLATNVAETSLTVPGIRYVIDPGVARISRYSVRSKVQQLPIEPVSRASADQRKGRCGRVSDGVCFRLYSEEDFLRRPEFTQPEILRTNLAAVILQMLQLHLGDMAKFPFVERPDQRQINDGFQLLSELMLVNDQRHITRLGRDIVRYPVDLRLARMIAEAGKTGCLRELLIIASALTVQDPRERPHEKQQAADQAHRVWQHEQSDFMTLVNLWEGYELQRQALSTSQLRKYCKKNYLSFMRMREWRDVHRQLRILTRESGLRENREAGDYASVHRALLTGLLGNIGEKTAEHEYTGARGKKHFIFPASGQFKRKPRWIVSSELVETTRLYGRNVAQIESQWIEPLAKHLVRRNYLDPFFDPGRGQVMVHEQVSLYGLLIVRKRLTGYATVNPAEARDIFIQEGLVLGRLKKPPAFVGHNQRLLREAEQLESKTRRRDIVVDMKVLFEFYDQQLPTSVHSEFELDRFVQESTKQSLQQLKLTQDALLQRQVDLPAALYPDTIEVADNRLKLNYRFDPQHEEDGLSVNVPVSLLKQVKPEQLEFVIPGLMEEKCLALIKSLPKSIRRNFVPAPDYAAKVAADLSYDGRSLTAVVAEKLFRLTGNRVNAEDFQLEMLDRHLTMNIRVVDPKGKLLGGGRQLESLVSQYSDTTSVVPEQSEKVGRSGMTDWAVDELPAEVSLKEAGITIRRFPALVDEGSTVGVQVFDTKTEADRQHNQGLLRLILLSLPEQKRYVQKNIPGFEKLALFYVTRGSRQELLDAMVMAIFRYTFIEDQPSVRSRDEFAARLLCRQQLMETANVVANAVGTALVQCLAIERQIKEGGSANTDPVFEDISAQLQRLVAPGFLDNLPLRWLKEYPRFMRAAQYRIDKLQGNVTRDAENRREIGALEAEFFALSADTQRRMGDYRFMLEELRVSLFAQPVGTSVPVSVKRLARHWQQAGPLK